MEGDGNFFSEAGLGLLTSSASLFFFCADFAPC